MKNIMCGMSCWPWDAGGFIFARFGRCETSKKNLKKNLDKNQCLV